MCSRAEHPPTRPNHPARSLQPALAFLGVAFLLLLLKLAVIDRVENPLRRSNLEGDHLRRVDVPSQVVFDGQLYLLGYDALAPETPGDRPLEVCLYWRDAVPGGPRYQVGLALKDGKGLRWSDPGLRPSRWHREPPPAYLWPPDEYAVTAFILRPLPGIPPGVYTVTLAVFDRETLATYSAVGPQFTAPRLEVSLGRVEVARPRWPLTPQAVVRPRYRLDTPFGPLRLVGYDVDREVAAPGDPFLMTLFWQADETPGEDLAVRLRLLDPAGGQAAAFDLPPASDGFATGQWQAGDLWRGQHLLRLPVGLESGKHRWALLVCRMEGSECRAVGEEVDLGSLQVHTPERLWVAPPLDVEVRMSLGGVATLLGAVLEPGTKNLQPATPLTVTLAWRAEAEMDVAYRVFLHLLGPDGGLVAQSDGEPVDGTRPTTGWLPGEVVLDRRVLSVPADAEAGEYQLRAGLYTLGEGRLTAPDGADAVQLTVVTVEEQ